MILLPSALLKRIAICSCLLLTSCGSSWTTSNVPQPIPVILRNMSLVKDSEIHRMWLITKENIAALGVELELIEGDYYPFPHMLIVATPANEDGSQGGKASKNCDPYGYAIFQAGGPDPDDWGHAQRLMEWEVKHLIGWHCSCGGACYINCTAEEKQQRVYDCLGIEL